MLDIQKMIIQTMKKEIFVEESKAARQVLSEIKTAYVDIQEEITAEIQNKILKKMKSTREKTISVYEKTDAVELLEKEKTELSVINKLLEELEQFLPKQMSEEEITEIVSKMKAEGKLIKDVMAFFKDKNADKKMVSNIFNKN
jgi:uncharacterized protein YqeY